MPDYEALLAGDSPTADSEPINIATRRSPGKPGTVERVLRIAAAGVPLAVGLHLADVRPASAQPLSPAHRIELTLRPASAENVEGGMFYNETNGGASADQGYFVRGAMWDAYRSLGREGVWGPPVSGEYVDEVGRVSQAFQRGIFQLTIGRSGAVEKVEFANVFDQLSAKGKDGWLEAVRQIPPSRDWSSDAGKSWDGVVANHLAVLDENPAIKRAFLSNPNWLEQYGLPMAMEDKGDQVVMRAQRGAFQQWKVTVPWAAAGQVTIALGGDIAKEAGGIIPQPTLALQRKADSVIAQGGGSAETNYANFEPNIILTDSASPEQLARGKAWIKDTLTNIANSGHPKLIEAADYITRANRPPLGTPLAQQVLFVVSSNADYEGPVRFFVASFTDRNGVKSPVFTLQVLAEQLGKYPDPLYAQAEVFRSLRILNGFIEILNQRGIQGYQSTFDLWKKADQEIKEMAKRASDEAVEVYRQMKAQPK